MGPSEIISPNPALRAILSVLSLPILGFLSFPALAAPPSNDLRAEALVLTPPQLPVTVSATNIDATIEADENTLGGICGASVWYKWTPTASGWVEIRTDSSDPDKNLDTVITIYEPGIGLLGFNDQFLDGNVLPSRLVFYADAGVAYEIGVYGYGFPTPDERAFELKIAVIPEPYARVAWVNASQSPVLLDPVEGTDVGAEVAILSSGDPFPSGSQGRIDAIFRDGSPLETAGLDASMLFWGSQTNGRYASAFNMLGSSPTGQWVFRVTIPLPSGSVVWTPRGDDWVEDLFLMNKNASGVFDVVELSGLPLWRKRAFGSPETTGNGADFADPDSDGIINFLEFAHGTLPLTRNASQTSLVTTQSGIVFRFRKGKEATAAGVQFHVEWTDSLVAAWRTDSVSLLKVAEDPESETIEASVSQTPTNARFFRLRVSK